MPEKKRYSSGVSDAYSIYRKDKKPEEDEVSEDLELLEEDSDEYSIYRRDKPALQKQTQETKPALVLDVDPKRLVTPETATRRDEGVSRVALRFSPEKQDSIRLDLEDKLEKLQEAEKKDLPPAVKAHLRVLQQRVKNQLAMFPSTAPEIGPEEPSREADREAMHRRLGLGEPKDLPPIVVLPRSSLKEEEPPRPLSDFKEATKPLIFHAVDELGPTFEDKIGLHGGLGRKTAEGDPAFLFPLDQQVADAIAKKTQDDFESWKLDGSTVKEVLRDRLGELDRTFEEWHDAAIASTPDEDLPPHELARKEVVLNKYREKGEISKLVKLIKSRQEVGEVLEVVNLGTEKNPKYQSVVRPKSQNPTQEGFDIVRKEMDKIVPEGSVYQFGINPRTLEQIWPVGDWRTTFEEDFRKEEHKRLIEEEGWPAENLSIEQDDYLNKFGYEETNKALAKILALDQNRILIDTDPLRTVSAIMEYPEYFMGIQVQSLLATLTPKITYKEFTLPDSDQTFAMMEAESAFDYFMRFWPSTVFAGKTSAYRDAHATAEMEDGPLNAEKLWDANLAHNRGDFLKAGAKEAWFAAEAMGAKPYSPIQHLVPTDHMASLFNIQTLTGPQKRANQARLIIKAREGRWLSAEFMGLGTEFGNALEVSSLGYLEGIEEGDLQKFFGTSFAFAAFAAELIEPDPISPLLAGASLTARSIYNVDKRLLRTAKQVRSADKVLEERGIAAAQEHIKAVDSVVNDLVNAAVQQKLNISPEVSQRVQVSEFIEGRGVAPTRRTTPTYVQPKTETTKRKEGPPGPRGYPFTPEVKLEPPEVVTKPARDPSGKFIKGKKEETLEPKVTLSDSDKYAKGVEKAEERLQAAEAELKEAYVELKKAENDLSVLTGSPNLVAEADILAKNLDDNLKQIREIIKKQNALIPKKKIQAMDKYKKLLTEQARIKKEVESLSRRLNSTRSKALTDPKFEAKAEKIENKIKAKQDRLSKIEKERNKILADANVTEEQATEVYRLAQKAQRLLKENSEITPKLELIADTLKVEVKGKGSKALVDSYTAQRRKLNKNVESAKARVKRAEKEFRGRQWKEDPNYPDGGFWEYKGGAYKGLKEARKKEIKDIYQALDDLSQIRRAENIQKAYREAIEEVASAIEKGVKSRRAWRRMGAGSRRNLQEMENLQDILNSATVSRDLKTGERIVDFVKFHEELTRVWGHAAVDRMMEMKGYGPAVFKKMLERVTRDFPRDESGKLISMALRKQGDPPPGWPHPTRGKQETYTEAGRKITKSHVFRAPAQPLQQVPLTVQEVWWLQDLPRYLDQAAYETAPNAEFMTFVNAIENAWKPSDYYQNMTRSLIWKPVLDELTNPHGTWHGLIKKHGALFNALKIEMRKKVDVFRVLHDFFSDTAVKRELGNVADELRGLNKAADHMITNFHEELLQGSERITEKISSMLIDDVIKELSKVEDGPRMIRDIYERFQEAEALVPTATRMRRDTAFRKKLIAEKTKEFYFDLLDGGEPFRVFGRQSFSNRGYSNTLWEDAVYHIAHDPQARLVGEEGIFRSEEGLWKDRRDYENRYREEIKRGDIDPKTNRPYEYSPQHALEYLEKEGIDSSEILRRIETGEAGNPAFHAISRAYITSGVHPTQARALYHWAYERILQISKDMDELVLLKNTDIAKKLLPKEELMKVGGMKRALVRMSKKDGISKATLEFLTASEFSPNNIRRAIKYANMGEDEFSNILKNITTKSRRNKVFSLRIIGREILDNSSHKLAKNLKLTTYEHSKMNRYHQLEEAVDPRKFDASLRERTRDFGIIDKNTAKSLSYLALGVAHGGMRNRVNDLMSHITYGVIDEKVAQNINNIFSTSWHEIPKLDPDESFVETVKATLDALNLVGIPITRDVVRQVDALGKEIKRSLRMIEVGRDSFGNSIQMLQAQSKILDEKLPKIAKELSLHYSRAPSGLEDVTKAFDYSTRLMKTSLVTGVIIPRPYKWITDFAGDTSQIYFDLGAKTAGKVAFTTLPENIPYFGKIFSEARSDMVKRIGKGDPNNVLASPIASLFDPVSGAILRGDDGILRTYYGVDIPYDEIIKTALDGGIFDTMVREEFLNQFTRLTPKSWENILGPVEKVKDSISQFANYTQSRMRFNLYIELLRQGKTPKDAAKKVLNALYDWKHGLAQGEVMSIARAIPFWRFWRLAWRQTVGAVLDPLIRPLDVLGKSIEGNTRIARLKNLYKVKEQIPFLLNPELMGAWHEDGTDYDQMAFRLRPEWARNRALITLTRNSRERIEFFQTVRGEEYNPTHNMILAPPLTQVDTFELLSLLPKACFAMAAKMGAIPEYELAPDWEASFFNPTLDMIHPAFKEPLEMMLVRTGVHTSGYRTGEWTNLSAWEKKAQDMTGFFETRNHPETGQPQGRPFSTMIHRMIPVFGIEATRLMNPLMFENPGWDQGVHAGLAYFAGNYSGLYHQRPFDPMREYYFHARSLDRHITKAYREAGGEEWPGYYSATKEEFSAEDE